MAETMRLFQLASVGVFVATLLTCFVGWRRYPAYRAAFFPALLSAAFGVVFYALWFTEALPAGDLLMWGAVQRFINAVVICGGMMSLVWAIGGRRNE